MLLLTTSTGSMSHDYGDHVQQLLPFTVSTNKNVSFKFERKKKEPHDPNLEDASSPRSPKAYTQHHLRILPF
jgi:hypothetical protein